MIVLDGPPDDVLVCLWTLVLFMGPLAGHWLVMLVANGIRPRSRHARQLGRFPLEQLMEGTSGDSDPAR